MINTQVLISVVDDDRSVRRALRRFPRTSGDATELFAPAQEFLSSSALSHTARLILDIQPKTLGAVPRLHLKGETSGSVQRARTILRPACLSLLPSSLISVNSAMARPSERV